jgi:hypothetical protein
MRLSLPRTLFPAFKEREDYYRNLIVKDTLETTVHALQVNDPGISKTFHDITFKEISWGSSEKELIRKFGPARYKFQKINDLDKHVILFFKTKVCGQNAIIQCHLLENELYFLHIDFVNSVYKDVKFIEEIIHKKYSPSPYDPEIKTCFEDYFQNKLLISHTVYMNICYISGQVSILQKFEKYLTIAKINRLRMKKTNPDNHKLF